MSKKKRIGRREAIGVMGAAGAALAFGCGSSPTEPGSGTSTTTTPGSTNSACAVTPSETAGPFPSLTDLFRSDIREGKPGTLLTLTIKVVNTNASCAAVPNANVEIWHVDAAGNYSQYDSQRTQNSCAESRPRTTTAKSRSRRSTRVGTRGAPRTFTPR